MNKTKEIQLFAVIFFVIAVLVRFIPGAYNMSAIGALGMFVACFWSARLGCLFALAAMGLSDLLGHWFSVPSMGFYAPWLMITVYSAVAFSAVFGKLIGISRRRLKTPLLVSAPLGAVGATVAFFLITNFAAWLDPQMPYPMTLEGLLQCYAAGIPFVKNTLIGNLLFSGLFFGVYSFALQTVLQSDPTAEIE